MVEKCSKYKEKNTGFILKTRSTEKRHKVQGKTGCKEKGQGAKERHMVEGKGRLLKRKAPDTKSWENKQVSGS